MSSSGRSRNFKLSTTVISLFIVMITLPVNADQGLNLLNVPVESFSKAKSNVPDIVSSIATSLSVPTGFEGAPVNVPTQITVAVKDSTLKVLLDSIVHADPIYEWTLEVQGEIVNIYPRDIRQRFLDVVIPRFTVQGKTRGEALKALTDTPAFALILHNLNVRLHTPLSGPPDVLQLGPPISIDLQDASLRKILNKIVTAAHGTGWSAVRYGDHLQYLSLKYRWLSRSFFYKREILSRSCGAIAITLPSQAHPYNTTRSSPSRLVTRW